MLLFANTPLRANAYRLLKTRWSNTLDHTNVHKEYPRPQLEREHWINLNGEWHYEVTSLTQKPDNFANKVLVPFPIESLLSGAGKGEKVRISPKQKLWYRRRFRLEQQDFDTLLLHFGGVDWETEVWVNSQYVGKHQGGHDAFYFDIAPFLNPTNDSGNSEQEILISVWDPSNKGPQPRGKQINRPGNIYYTPVTGIWQTVWLEPLSSTYIKKVNIESDIDAKTVTVSIDTESPLSGDEIEIKALKDNLVLASGKTSDGLIKLALPHDEVTLWSPDTPQLYQLHISINRNDKKIDSATSYFALRRIEKKKDSKCINRLFLNGQAVFQMGLLDQGWWPDGLYTAPSDEALKYDIEMTKAMGFNMIRKHVKVEPARWYFHCDKIGILVWQDMPTGDRSILPRQKDIKRSGESAAIFHRELEAMIGQLAFFQCIVCWVPFNEGWGQFNTNEVLQKVKKLDPSRLVDGPSGWVDRGQGDMHDYHIYGRRLFVGEREQNRALVIGELGGFGYRLKEHMAVTNSWSYNNSKSPEHLYQRYSALFEDQLIPLLKEGLAAAVYTQTTDIESEINGLLTYDREVCKVPVDKINAVHQKVYAEFNLCTSGQTNG
ncbi:hypothetical protein A8L45_16505 [Veronia pacifica]|uniref:Beta-galactosidase n=1 Tax=Veronia pacifica TaxID=1080227 RepID=A0A1C3EEA2_9GAMM|nr:hypothetical protein A8L45_16505 [Veronia pacifica]